MAQKHNPQKDRPWTWVQIRGSDAADLLHRVTTVHVQALDAGRGAPGCLLNATGRIRAFFWLWRLSNEEFGIELEAGAGEAAAAELLLALDQYIFAEKVEVSQVRAQSCAWFFFEPGEANPWTYNPGMTELIQGIRICDHGSDTFGRTWVSAWAPVEQLGVWLSAQEGFAEISRTELDRYRVEALGPWPGNELTDQTNPLEAGFPQAVSTTKGCYPGQEVIERTVTQGSPPWRLVRVRFNDSTARGAGEVLNNLGDSQVGRVTTGAPGAALALVRKIHAKEGQVVKSADGAEGVIESVSSYESQT